MPSITSDTCVTIIGGGKIGEAILSGWIASQRSPACVLSPHNFTVVDPSEDRRAYLTRTYALTCVPDVADVSRSDIVVLSVKPDVMPDVLKAISTAPFYACESAPLFISVAAGLGTKRLESALPVGARLVRTMPNTPLMVGEGATGIAPGSLATNEDVSVVQSLFSCLGVAVVVDESMIDVICGLSGSGPAYVCAMIQSLTSAATDLGLDASLAETLALQTVYGTSKLIMQTGRTPEQVRVSVCSPGGTTLAALKAFAAAGLDEAYAAGVNAAVRRSKELAGE